MPAAQLALAQAQTAPLAEIAYDAMRRRILDNVWSPGYQSLEQDIASELGMSRTPVREALMRLASEGLVEVAPRRGVRVLPVSAKDMKDIYEVLTALECMATELVANSKPTQADLAPLVKATNAMEMALAVGDLEAWAKADEQFHKTLIQMAGNQWLMDCMMSCWDRAHRARMFSLRLRPQPINSTQEHTALVKQLAAGDAKAAAQINREHRERASRELLTIFETYRLHHL